jgi:hypothetical protein
MIDKKPTRTVTKKIPIKKPTVKKIIKEIKQ